MFQEISVLCYCSEGVLLHMAAFIEGVGDEVLYFLLAIIVIVLVSLAWISTGIPPVDYYVWLVQMQIHPDRRVVQVLHVNNQEPGLFRGRPVRRRSGAATEQELEAFMDSGVVDRNNTSDDRMEMPRSDRNDSTSLSVEEASDVEQVSIRAETAQTDNTATEFSGEQQSDDRSTLTSNVENEKNSRTNDANTGIKRELAQQFVTQSAAHRIATEECAGDHRQLSSVKLKFLDDSQIVACTALESTVGQFKRRYFCESLLAGKVVRLIYRGQLLRDDTRSLLSYGLHDQCVVHCHVSSTPYAQPSSSTAANASTDSNVRLPEPSADLNSGAAAAAIAAIAGAQSVPINTAGQLTRRIIQTFRGRPIEDNRNDPILVRLRNAFLRSFRYTYNAIMGPDPGAVAMGASLDAAADAAARGGWNENQNPVGTRIGQYIHIIFIVKFVTLWTFVFLYPQYTDRFSLLLLTFLSIFFATILFSNTHRAGTNNNSNNTSGFRAQT